MRLRTKLLLPLLSFSILLAAYLFLFWMPSSIANAEKIYHHSTERHLHSVAEGLTPLLLGNQLDTVYENLNALLAKNKDWLSIQLINARGQQIYPLGPSPSPDKPFRNNIQTFQKKIVYLDTYLGIIKVRVNFNPSLADIKKRHYELLAIFLVILSIFIFTVGFVLDKVVRRPVGLLAHASKKLSKGDFDTPLLKTGNDEVGTLVDSFAEMRDAIRRYQSELLNEITKQREAEEALRESESNYRALSEAFKHQAYHDPLTNLPNRMLFIEHLTSALTHAHRNRQMVAVMFLDLDRFKDINDTLGHTAGDQLLKDVAARLKGCIRESDIVARIGGDEFTILLPEMTNPEDSSMIASKIISAMQNPYKINSHELHITTSIGISIYPDDSNDPETIMKNADIAMYHAKEQGRNNYQFYNADMNIRTIGRILRENSLRQAVERKELVIHYQPQLDIFTRQVVSAEALVRWQHPDEGLLSPKEFIPLAEEIGLIVPIGEWVMRNACAQNKAWQEAGYPPICVTVNLSARQFQQPDLVEMVSNALKDTGLSPEFLELEITESTAMKNIELTISRMNRLTGMGVKFSIDDFGTGYSSLSYLKKLPIQTLKIDKSFIRGLSADPDDKAIVNAVIAMAHNLKLKVIAEGVETDDQMSFLNSSRCDRMQGYLYSKPLPAEDFKKLIWNS